jgi:hypothetical protein
MRRRWYLVACFSQSDKTEKEKKNMLNRAKIN